MEAVATDTIKVTIQAIAIAVPVDSVAPVHSELLDYYNLLLSGRPM